MKTNFLEWRDVKINPFVSIERVLREMKSIHKPVSQVIIDRQLVAEGYVFVVEYLGDMYLLVNAYDLDRAVSGLPWEVVEESRNALYGIPVTEDRELIQKVMCGVFYSGAQFASLTNT